MRLPARQASRKVGRKGKREERETHSFSHFPFRFPPSLPLPFFALATHVISKVARPRGQSAGTPNSVYGCRNYNHGIDDVSQA